MTVSTVAMADLIQSINRITSQLVNYVCVCIVHAHSDSDSDSDSEHSIGAAMAMADRSNQLIG